MGKIVLLDDLTINQIAAGEVIERPASVVKELVENSIDAGARKITVDIKNGGISYIRITDDGYGIMPDDMEIAFERHATSKIRESRDLEYVRTMGFRGEALASIGAIAKVQMLSKAIGQDNGYQVEVEGGDIIDKHEAGCAPGTSITVKELFYNTPVRYKFLKKDFTESGYIEDAIKRLALVNPNISFKFINNGKIELQTSGNGRMEDVVYAIYGKEVLENIIPVDYQYEDIYIKGVIGKPMIARSNRTNQLFFVNKRFIKDKTLSSAAEQGFKGLVTIGKHGFLILNLDMDPKKLDVNVHPTKMEVRFQEESKIFKAVFHAVKDTMLKTDLITNHEKEHFSDDKVDFDKDVKNDNLTNSARLKFWGLNKEEKFNEKENKDFDFFKNLKSPNVKSMDVVQDTPYGEKSEFEVDDKIGKINEELDKIQKSRNNKIEYNLNRYDHLGENASVADKMNLLNDTVGNDYGMINDEEKEIKNTNSENQEENKDIVNDSLSNVTDSNVNDDKLKTEEIEVINDIKKKNNNININKLPENGLEYLTFQNYIDGLFISENSKSIEEIIKEVNNEKNKEGATIEDIVNIINNNAEKTMWEDIFNDINDIKIEFSREDIDNIRKIRNEVVHNKEIKSNKYEEYKKIINESNKKIKILIKRIEEEKYRDRILENIKLIVDRYKEILDSISNAFKVNVDLIKPINDMFNRSYMMEDLNKKIYSNQFNLPAIQNQLEGIKKFENIINNSMNKLLNPMNQNNRILNLINQSLCLKNFNTVYKDENREENNKEKENKIDND